MLKLVDIRKNFKIGPNEVEVLKGISLTVDKGELLSIIGPSGSGKSTLMYIIGLLDQPTSGKYYVDDKLITYDDDKELSNMRNKTIGFVFQQYYLLPRLTALENVCIPLIYRGTPEKEMQDMAVEYLRKVDMVDRAHYRPNALSGGQQQRVAVARALVGNPSIILADEPTGALDSKTGQDILELFKSLNASEGITILVITHDQKIAVQCKRIEEIKDGVVTEGLVDTA